MAQDASTTDASGAISILGQSLVCPRCTYDLAGQPENSSTGMCPECGLEFEWELLRKVPPPPAWCLELCLGNGAPILTLVRAAFGTIRVIWTSPRRLWTGVVLGHPIAGWALLRATALTLAAAAVTYIFFSAVMAMISFWLIHLRNNAEQAATGQLWHRPAEFESFVREVWPMVLVPGVPWTVTSGDASRAVLLALHASMVILLMPLGFLLLGTTMERAKVRRAHLLRALAYGTILVPVPLIFVSVVTWASLTLDLLAGWLAHTKIASHPGVGAQAIQTLYGAARLSESVGPLASYVACLLLTWSFWRRVSGSYMKLPSAGIDTAILQFMIILLVPVIAITMLSVMRHL